MESNAFNASEFDQSLGSVSSETILNKPETIIPESDRQALNQIAAETPRGIITPPTSSEADYFSPFETELTEDAPIDYAAKLEELTGEKPDGEVDSDGFYQKVVSVEAEQNFLNQHPDYKAAKDLINRQYGSDEDRNRDDLDLIGSAVKNYLGETYTARSYEQKMLDYEAGEGTLTDEGKAYAARLRENLKQWIGQVEAKAKEYGGDTAKQTLEHRQKIREQAAGFKPLGVTLDEGVTEKIANNILSGRLDEKLNSLSIEDAYWVELALNPSFRLAFAKAIDSRGKSLGAKAKLANVLR